MTLSGVVLGLIGREVSQAYSEQTVFRELQRRGARGDDWVGWKELLLGRQYAPIVEIWLPKDLQIRDALPYLTRLDNLESLSIHSESITLDELNSLKSLVWISSLSLDSASVTDDSVSAIMKFGHLRWLDLNGTHISEEGGQRIKAALPKCNIKM